MKIHTGLLALALILSASVAKALSAGPDGRHLRLMTYNIHNGIGMDNVTDYGRIASVIDSVLPDIVAIQEADSATHRSRGADVMAELGKATGMHHTFAPAIDYDGGRYGIGILSRARPLRTYSVPLPGREEQRVLLVAEFEDFIFASTHLSLTEADRELSLPVINATASSAGKPFFLAGDFNASPDSRFISGLSRSFTILTPIEAATCPADSPVEMIDYITLFAPSSRSVTITSAEIIPQTAASDHRPVVCGLTITEQ